MEEAIGLFIVGFIGILVLLFIVTGVRKLAGVVPTIGAPRHRIVSKTRKKRFKRKFPMVASPVHNLSRSFLSDLLSGNPLFSHNKGWVKEILYHGTPDLNNVTDVINGRGTFVIGNGNAYGTGLYLADLKTAKGYAQPGGAVLGISLHCPADQVIDYNYLTTSAGFQNWAKRYGSGNHGNDITNYCIIHLKKRFIKVNENLYVALSEQTAKNERVQFKGLYIFGCYNATGKSLI